MKPQPFAAYSTIAALLAAAVIARLVPGPLWAYIWRVGALFLAVAGASLLLVRRVRPTASPWPERPESGDFAGIDVSWWSWLPGFWQVEAAGPQGVLQANGWHQPGRRRVRLEEHEVRRGVHSYTLRMTYRDPLGFFSRVVWQGTQDLVVRPRVVPLPRLHFLHGSRGEMIGARRATRSDAPAGVRRYLPGDRLAQVHWPQTVRTGEVQVREAYTRGSPFRTIALDTREGSYPDEAAFELAVSVAGSLAFSFTRRGESVALLAGEHYLSGRETTAVRLMDALTRVALGEGSLDLPFTRTTGLLYVGGAQGSVAARAASPLATVVGVGRGAQVADLVIPDWPALWRMARGMGAAR